MLTAPKITDSPTATLDGTDRLIQGVFEPPNSFALTAIARHKGIVCAIIALFTLLGAAYGLSRHRTYTTSATLQVGQVNPNSPGFYGYVQSAASLATAFSRAIDAEPVLQTVEHNLKLTPTQATARLSASPIPASPAFRVIATGPTEHDAIDLANTAASAVIAYESHSNSTNPDAASLLHQYQEAALALRRIAASSAHLGGRRASASIDALAAAEAAKKAAAVKLGAIGVAYTQAVTSEAPSSGLLGLVAGATTVSSDHRSKVELYCFIGFLVGIIAGCLAAIFWEQRRLAARTTGGTRAEVQTSESV